MSFVHEMHKRILLYCFSVQKVVHLATETKRKLIFIERVQIIFPVVAKSFFICDVYSQGFKFISTMQPENGFYEESLIFAKFEFSWARIEN